MVIRIIRLVLRFTNIKIKRYNIMHIILRNDGNTFFSFKFKFFCINITKNDVNES